MLSLVINIYLVRWGNCAHLSLLSNAIMHTLIHFLRHMLLGVFFASENNIERLIMYYSKKKFQGKCLLILKYFSRSTLNQYFQTLKYQNSYISK